MNGQFIFLVISVFAIALATKHILNGFIVGSIPIGSLVSQSAPSYNYEIFLLFCFIFGVAMLLKFGIYHDRNTKSRT